MFMSLVFFLRMVLGGVFLLPLMQQGISLVGLIFFLSRALRVLIGIVGLSWFGFSLFLIYVGSLLVMFGYVVAMVPNFFLKRFSFFNVFLFGGFVGFLVGVKSGFLEGLCDVGGFMFSDEGFFVFLGLGFVLLIALVCVVKICYFRKGSLRPFSL